jgi:8-hydroxy-5-deazaflavin:NADPH oxidoreductase
MQIGILGSGLMGGKLGTIFARAGHKVVFSYSRDSKKLDKLAKRAGKNACAGSPLEAASGADAVLLAVHWSRVDDVLNQAGSLAGKTVITCSLPMSMDDSHLVLGHSTSGAEQLSVKVRKAHVVSAFSTAPSELFFPLVNRRKTKSPPNLVYCGDNASAKKKTASLIRCVGFKPIDVGKLSIARYLEPFALLMAEIAYNGSGTAALGYELKRVKR